MGGIFPTKIAKVADHDKPPAAFLTQSALPEKDPAPRHTINTARDVQFANLFVSLSEPNFSNETL
ncbi:hypothetical protein B5G09_03060 [Alistipes sp. An54]|nr:hypothetical protein B5G09_03060 [Alistipes sp. An54]